MSQPIDLGHRMSLIDLYDLRMPQRTGTYVLHEENVAIIETGPSPSVPHLLAGLKALQIDPADIRYIIVTHIHLDHAGGVGMLLEHCPNATVVVHPKGKRHLADPSRLIAGAKAVYGAQFDALFDPIVPVPEERLIVKEDGETLVLSAERTLTFYDTPGHANHHFSIYDSYSGGVFTGDTIGVFYPQLQEAGLAFCLPSTSPNQFDPEAMERSAERLEQLNPTRIYFGHFGALDQPKEAFRQLRFWLPKFVAAGNEAIARHPEAPVAEQAKAAAQRLRHDIMAFLNEHGVSSSSPAYAAIELDLQVCAMGMIDYWQKQR
ncbi:MBL fold metallo-hydrolase [Geobacillus sp. 46C-IIa]|uniref:MBL fold metallo-hydrolase n=1 Tax=Geobacillus sp. 46C-IIa TaxID=1963025 RepID=UPI0009BF5CCF|nr:MBL fold metallo-hydrolase [Geobacillus sp. 46C-IIa]OQP07221.1 MBL fold metallo-hydrolase [Geobacillus sp. 46C-IIa]QNU29546.1 MBL fold metallo-hydrolase [Geobacillus sp. 46C-IIa]